jgi:hypothetical protein
MCICPPDPPPKQTNWPKTIYLCECGSLYLTPGSCGRCPNDPQPVQVVPADQAAREREEVEKDHEHTCERLRIARAENKALREALERIVRESPPDEGTEGG